MDRYVALLRGINVGGKNRILMAELRASFEEIGFEGARTYIQSGNVVFGAQEAAKEALVARLEAGLSERFDFDARVVVRSQEEMEAIVGGAPDGFGSEPDVYRYDVIFLKEPLTAEEAMAHVSTREGVDEAYAGDGVLYFSRLTSQASQSRMSKIISSPIYQDLTIRNWRTTGRILEMMREG